MVNQLHVKCLSLDQGCRYIVLAQSCGLKSYSLHKIKKYKIRPSSLTYMPVVVLIISQLDVVIVQLNHLNAVLWEPAHIASCEQWCRCIAICSQQFSNTGRFLLLTGSYCHCYVLNLSAYNSMAFWLLPNTAHIIQHRIQLHSCIWKCVNP